MIQMYFIECINQIKQMNILRIKGQGNKFQKMCFGENMKEMEKKRSKFNQTHNKKENTWVK